LKTLKRKIRVWTAKGEKKSAFAGEMPSLSPELLRKKHLAEEARAHEKYRRTVWKNFPCPWYPVSSRDTRDKRRVPRGGKR